MGTWILVLIVSGGYWTQESGAARAVAAIEFSSEQACLDARNELVSKNKQKYFPENEAECFRK